MNRGGSFLAGVIQGAVGNHTREELEMIIMGGASLHPTRITFTCKIQRTVIRRLASAFSTFHFFAHLIENRGEERRQYLAYSSSRLQSKKDGEENNNISRSHLCSQAEWKCERERDKGGEVLVFLDLIVTFGREFENGGRLDGEASTWLSYKVSETG